MKFLLPVKFMKKRVFVNVKCKNTRVEHCRRFFCNCGVVKIHVLLYDLCSYLLAYLFYGDGIKQTSGVMKFYFTKC